MGDLRIEVRLVGGPGLERTPRVGIYASGLKIFLVISPEKFWTYKIVPNLFARWLQKGG